MKNIKRFYNSDIVLDPERLSFWNDNIDKIKEEVVNLNKKLFIKWPYDTVSFGEDWKVIPIHYNINHGGRHMCVWIEEVEFFLPMIYNFVKTIPNLRVALVSKLTPRTIIKQHFGWSILSNDVLRVHLPIIIKDSGVWVEDVAMMHEYGKALVFDDSLLHTGFNRDEIDSRYILILDILRPEGVPKGTSTEETDETFEKMMKSELIVKKLYRYLNTVRKE